MLFDDIFRKFRTYGTMEEITVNPKGLISECTTLAYVSVEPLLVEVHYRRLEGAIAAHNCLRNAVVTIEVKPEATPGTTLSEKREISIDIDYVEVYTMSWLAEQFKVHPKIMFPVAAFLLAMFFTFVLFDPVRTLYILQTPLKMKLTVPTY